MKNQLLILALAAVALTAYGDESSAPIYLPAGTYSQTFSHIQSTCQGWNPPTANLFSYGNGQVCGTNATSRSCVTVNFANNPCYSENTSYGNLVFTNCKLTTNGAILSFYMSSTENNCFVKAINTLTFVSGSSDSNSAPSNSNAELSSNKPQALFGFINSPK